jgi:type IV pilus assembly protein PilM
MLKISSSLKSIGLELTSTGLAGAEVIRLKGKPHLQELFNLPLKAGSVKRLYIDHPLLTTGLNGNEVLLRPMNLPLTKEKDIDEALAFQAEPLLPYPIDQALLAHQIIKKEHDSTDILILSARKECLESHLNQFKALEIEPEKVSCIQAALFQFAKTYFSLHQNYLILHLGEDSATALLIKKGLMAASFTQKERINVSSGPKEEMGRFDKTFSKLIYALAKEVEDPLEGVIFTGESAKREEWCRTIADKTQLTLLQPDAPSDAISMQSKLIHALPIGLAIQSLPKTPLTIDFRQQEWVYPHPWKRLKVPVAIYFLLMLALSTIFYFFGHNYLDFKENQIRQEYVNVLAGMNKTHEQFESVYLAKTPSAREKFNGEEPEIFSLNKDDFLERLAFLQKELQSTPDSFPLFANIPRVSDVLAWLSRHPAVAYEEGTKLQIENFSYMILKRPMQGKKQEKYQVKVELEFSSPTPKWAREFHDALIASNDWVDPKGEVKWSSNRGRYKTSFYLKDKTIYPSQ